MFQRILGIHYICSSQVRFFFHNSLLTFPTFTRHVHYMITLMNKDFLTTKLVKVYSHRTNHEIKELTTK